MPLQIVGGKLCCIWGLALCSTPTTDSGLRIKTIAVSGDATKIVVYGGNCYVILKNITTCGTVITPASVVSSCTDAACGFTTCPSCQFSDSYAVGGLIGTCVNCYTGGPLVNGSWCSCTAQPPDWDGMIYRSASAPSDTTHTTCTDQNVNRWEIYRPSANGCVGVSLALADGSNVLLSNVTLTCHSSGRPDSATGAWWQIHVSTAWNCQIPGQPCGREPQADYWKPISTGPAGTYTRYSDGLCCDLLTPTCPASITVS